MMNKATNQFDYVVIGGGHNGLAAACYLQKAGKSTVVLEATERFGGAAHTGALIANAPDHYISLGAQDEFYFSQSGIIDELQLRDVGYQDVDHSQLAWLDQNGDASLLLQRNWRKVLANVERFSYRDARRLDEMADLAWPILEAMRYFQFQPASSRSWYGTMRRLFPFVRGKTRRFLSSLLLEAAEDYVLDQFESEAVRSLLLASASIYGDISWRGSASVILSAFLLAKWGSRRPIGGMQAIPDALARRLQALGGTLHSEAIVKEIIFDGDKASGVRLANGQIYQARYAVTMAAAPNLLADLVPRQHLSDGLYVKLTGLPMNSHGSGPFKVDLALSGRLQITRHQRWRDDLDGVDLRGPSMACANYQELRDTLALNKSGQYPTSFPFWTTIFTERDRSLAPAGQDVLYLFAHLPVDIDGGWPANKERLAEELIDKACAVYGNLRELVIGSIVTSPKDFEEKWNIRNGQYYHVDNQFMRLGPLRPAFGLGAYKLPIPGVYLAGSGASPGGGVGGLPGRAAALKALADARKSSGG